MGIRYSRFTGLIHYLGDISLLALSFLLSLFFEYHSLSEIFFIKNQILLVLLISIWSILVFFLKIYDIPRVSLLRDVLLDLIKLVLLHVAVITAVVVLVVELQHSNQFFLSFYLCTLFLVLSWRLGFLLFLQYYRKIGFNYRNIIVVGYDEVSRELVKYFESRPSFGYRFRGFFDDRKRKQDIKGRLEEIEHFVIQEDIDEIYCSISRLSQHQLNKLVQIADNNLIRLKLIPDYREFVYDDIKVNHYGRFPIITFRHEPLNNYINQLLKRVFDISFSLLVIVLFLSWLFPLIALIIKLNSPGPILFFQKRTGLYNRTFWCWKFRTMKVNDEAHTRKTSPNDERITSVGKFLRKTNLDELPQFFNVLFGDMSVVGPRPYMLVETEYFSKLVEKYMVRHLVKPGITGLSQSRGLRGPTPNTFVMKQRVKMDIFYIENWSFLLDLKIILRTSVNMIRGDRNAF